MQSGTAVVTFHAQFKVTAAIVHADVLAQAIVVILDDNPFVIDFDDARPTHVSGIAGVVENVERAVDLDHGFAFLVWGFETRRPDPPLDGWVS